jgi:hypothetical protein
LAPMCANDFLLTNCEWQPREGPDTREGSGWSEATLARRPN